MAPASPKVVETYKHLIYYLNTDPPGSKHIITVIEPNYAVMGLHSDTKNIKEGDYLEIVPYARKPDQPPVYKVHVRRTFRFLVLHSPVVLLDEYMRIHTIWPGLRYRMLGFSSKDAQGNAILSCTEGTIADNKSDSTGFIPTKSDTSLGDIGGPCFRTDDPYAFVGINVTSAGQLYAKGGIAATFDVAMNLIGRSHLYDSGSILAGISYYRSKDEVAKCEAAGIIYRHPDIAYDSD